MLEKLAGLLGPAPRTASQWTGFARLDWQPGERHRFTLEGTGARSDAPGGGLTRASEPYGIRSFGDQRCQRRPGCGRWEAFLTPNLLAVTQGSMGRHILDRGPETPSAFEQTLNVQHVGGSCRRWWWIRAMGSRSEIQRASAGAATRTNISMKCRKVLTGSGRTAGEGGLRAAPQCRCDGHVANQPGTYHYANVANFVSDALVFGEFGMADELDPMNQHNCDQRVKRGATRRPTSRAWIFALLLLLLADDGAAGTGI